MPEREIIETGVLVAIGGAVGHFLSYLLRFLKLRSDKDSMLVDRTLQYSDALRKDIDEMKAELTELRRENAELKEQIHSLSAKLENLYERNLELLRADKSHREHIESCVVLQRTDAEEKKGE
jgi:uncharacterized coiled-coil DUF342 family protein